jgi:hypothetical protein
LNPGVSNITFLIISHDFSPWANISRIFAVSYFNATDSIFELWFSLDSKVKSDFYDWWKLTVLIDYSFLLALLFLDWVRILFLFEFFIYYLLDYGRLFTLFISMFIVRLLSDLPLSIISEGEYWSPLFKFFM